MMEETMIFVANQLFSTHPQGIEQQLAACSGLSQSISEEFDRSTELQAQTVQLACESWSQFYSTLWQVKDPQEFFMLLSAQLHASAEQTQHYWHAAQSLTQQIQKKMFALEQTLSPIITESLIDITPAPELKTVSVAAKVATELSSELPTELSTKLPTKAANKAVTVVQAKTVPVKRSTKQEVETTIAAVVASKTKAQSKAKPEVKSLQPATVIASVAPETLASAVKVKRVRTSTTTTKPVEVDALTITDTTNPTKPPSKVRQVKKTEPIAETAEVAEVAEVASNDATTIKKSAVVGLPTKSAAKPGFPGVAGQPGYKAKSSKATGAKKRVRQ
jgi:hypothetical protein